ncbi:MAG: DUF4157 domain-containing protein [Kofleriaceae bacterium]
MLQRKARGEGVDDMSVAQAGFAGTPGAIPYQSEMEAGFGTSFGGVQAHFGDNAAQASKHLGAEAYTVGQSVAFADANPSKAVVAHELAHTIQQGGSASPGGAGVQTYGGAGAYEHEADDAAATVLSGGKAEVNLRTGSSIQRWGGSDHYHIGNLAGEKALRKVRALGVNPATKTVDTAHPDAAGTAPEGRRDLQNPTATETVDVNTGRTWGGLGAEGHISFGAATRYGGDYVTTADGLKAQTREADLRLAHDTASMIGGASTNANHFYPLNRIEYQQHHATALAAARGGDMVTALTQEGFANHFLADCFASGHCVPRALDSIEALHNEDPEVVVQAGIFPAGFWSNARKGLMRSHDWHNVFCALPDGLPMSDGNRYHGDYYMDGSDLARVSDVASESLAEVLAAGEGKTYRGHVAIVTPDFAGIQADPVAGPMWRAMMKDYKADLDKARAAIGRRRGNSRGRTDGGSGFDSKAVLAEMETNVFGAGQVVTRHNDLDTRRHDVVKAFEAIEHYSTAQFSYNANLGPDGQNDDLEAPDEDARHEKAWDPAKMESQGLLGGALEAARKYQQGVAAAQAAGEPVGDDEAELAMEAVEAAQQLTDNVAHWYSGIGDRFAGWSANFAKARRTLRQLVPRIRASRPSTSTNTVTQPEDVRPESTQSEG